MKRKENTIRFINAKKGSGKTILATALAYAQNKRVIWITPLKSGYYPHKADLQNVDIVNHAKQFNFFVVNAEGFAEKISEILQDTKRTYFFSDRRARQLRRG